MAPKFILDAMNVTYTMQRVLKVLVRQEDADRLTWRALSVKMGKVLKARCVTGDSTAHGP
eukprot:943228-Lingulodinium_polyedra.AAC.1